MSGIFGGVSNLIFVSSEIVDLVFFLTVGIRK